MKLYIYDDNKEVLAVIDRDNYAACEKIASDQYPDAPDVGWTYSPAFGTVDGLTETINTEYI